MVLSFLTVANGLEISNGQRGQCDKSLTRREFRTGLGQDGRMINVMIICRRKWA